MAGLALNDRRFAIAAVRWLLGVQSFISGINWWVKLLPFPNIAEPVAGPVKHEILRTMVESGWMFTATKGIEILLGLALILNRHVLLMLVLSFPVMLMTFLLDFFPFAGKLGGFVTGSVAPGAMWASTLDMLYFGAGVFVMQAYLMSEYFDRYRPMFAVRPDGDAPAWAGFFEAGWLKLALRWLSYTVGATSTLWIVGMAIGLIPWSSLAVLAPPR
ncbi:hypothetical protein ACFQ1E_19985 [Sphingomonas canadensis]|uniref:DoxX family protein n=1 Tax=Sphingomonas canadensis TaxID=1219257 RepID=A0ABW3HDX0_9SPHN|nr:hypothetical protein [Sphingomonas canadensis]MCW3838330.1 hypothetical protein [Sphingomonas canadensis]